jgi:thiamine biosynthesis lipoprotein
MGTSFELGVVSDNEVKADGFLEKGIQEIKRIEDLFTEFKPQSLTSQINQNAGVKETFVSPEFFALIQRCLHISKLSQAHFDISVGILKDLYQFKNAAFSLPKRNIINKALKNVGYDKIDLNVERSSVFLQQKGMKISFAAIGKGYAADLVKRKWQEQGVQSVYINASGDLTAFGKNVDGKAWRIGIANPDDRQEIILYVPLENAAVATSGDYEQHFLYQGARYSHNINPKTGLPIKGIKSVSVFSPAAEFSDALSTAVYAMGRKAGLSFINSLPQIHNKVLKKILKMKMNLILILVFCLLGIKVIAKDSLLVISSSMSESFNLPKEEKYANITNYLESEFKSVTYIKVSKTDTADSLYEISKRAILIEERWTKALADNCCFGDCGNNKIWVKNLRVRIKSKIESEYLLESFDNNLLLKIIIKSLKIEEDRTIEFPKKLFIIHNNKNEIEENYFKELKQEFGKNNVKELTFQNRNILSKIDYNFIKVIFSFISMEERVVELIDEDTGKILRRLKIK